MKFEGAILLMLTLIINAGKAKAQVASPHQSNKVTVLATASNMDEDIKDLRYIDLESHLKGQPASTERSYFAGIFANKSGKIKESVSLLEEAYRLLAKSERSRRALALMTLADDYLKLFRYKDATQSYQTVLDEFPNDIDPGMLAAVKDDLGVIRLLNEYPAQTINRNGPVLIKTVKSKIGTLDGQFSLRGVQSNWILDTGANFSVVTASLAKQLGIIASAETAQTKSGISGLSNTIRVGLLPEFTVGGATIRNIVVLVFEDKDLLIPLGSNVTYQINGILGYPVFESLGTATFSADGHFSGDPIPEESSSRLFMNKLTPLVEGTIEKKQVLFAFDTGANVSQFTQRYYKAFPQQFKSLKKVQVENGGAGGSKTADAYVLPAIDITIGGKDVALHNIPVATDLFGTEIDDSYGNLGRDVTANFKSFTLDFSKMQFSLGKPLGTSH